MEGEVRFVFSEDDGLEGLGTFEEGWFDSDPEFNVQVEGRVSPLSSILNCKNN